MKQFLTVTHFQMFLMSILVGLISGGMVVAYLKYETIKLIPIVELSPGGECIKVVNFENGEAFNCQDVDVLLRRYRTVYAKSNSPEKAGN